MTMTKILTGDAINYLNRVLNLPAMGCEQDWDIELADANRINEFVLFYEEESLSDDKRSALMALIIASLEDLAYAEPIDKGMWGKISKLLCLDYELHQQLIQYWSLMDKTNEEDFFEITKLMRLLTCHQNL